MKRGIAPRGRALSVIALGVASLSASAQQAPVPSGPELILQEGHSGQVTSVAIAPGGKWFVSGGKDKRLILWDAATLREVRSLNLDDDVEALAISPDGDWIGASVKGHPLFVRVADFQQVQGSEKNSQPGAIFFLPVGEQAV